VWLIFVVSTYDSHPPSLPPSLPPSKQAWGFTPLYDGEQPEERAVMLPANTTLIYQTAGPNPEEDNSAAEVYIQCGPTHLTGGVSGGRRGGREGGRDGWEGDSAAEVYIQCGPTHLTGGVSGGREGGRDGGRERGENLMTLFLGCSS